MDDYRDTVQYVQLVNARLVMENTDLRRELEAARAFQLAMAERIYICSGLLSKVAEKMTRRNK